MNKKNKTKQHHIILGCRFRDTVALMIVIIVGVLTCRPEVQGRLKIIVKELRPGISSPRRCFTNNHKENKKNGCALCLYCIRHVFVLLHYS